MLKEHEIRPLTRYAEFLTNWYIDVTTPKYRKKRGQFFTPEETSHFMVRQSVDLDKKETIKILDPGAGIGIFESALCEYFLSTRKTQKVLFDLYENDENIIYLLNHNMNLCKASMARAGLEMSYTIHEQDFILSNSPVFTNELKDFNPAKDGYDIVICNPPYYKLNKGSPQAIVMQSILSGQPNIYTLFMALSARLLKEGGQITVLTPRSYCSGVYFRNFRNWFFKNVSPVKIHVFESRKKVFKKYNVNQEMIILTAIKSLEIPETVTISTSNSEPHRDDLMVRKVDYSKIIVGNDDITVRIPTSELDESIATQIDKFGSRLNDLGLRISTGPVVPFRSKDYLLSNMSKKCKFAPLIWMQNIVNSKVEWPIQKNGKPIAVRDVQGSEKILIPNGNYVLIKRFSSKEGKRRINAGILLENYLASEHIGVENHVNYICRADGKLTENEAYGITALLNSKLYNRYFQMTNGSTQVNATDISNIPLPSLETIRSIGDSIRKEKENSETKNEKIILDKLSVEHP